MRKVIQFSGGKDSIVCLHLFKDDPEAVALWTDTGNSFPHIGKYVRDMCELYQVELMVAKPEIPVLQWQNENGLPADVVPWDATPAMAGISKNDFGARLVPYTDCCSANIWQPMHKAVIDSGIKHVVRGSKKADHRVGVEHGFTEDGVYYDSPLWDWTDADVFGYIEKHEIPLLDNYHMSDDSDSLDCWCCTAYLEKSGRSRAEYIEKTYPEFHDLQSGRIEAVKQTVRAAVSHYGLGVS